MREIVVSMCLIVALSALPTYPAIAAQPACDHSHLENLYIVDAHSHFFNVDYLPEKGMLYRFGVPWPLAGLTASLLHGLTTTIDPDDVAPPAATIDLAILDDLGLDQLREYVNDELLDGKPVTQFFVKILKLSLRRTLVRIRMAEAVANEPALETDASLREAREDEIKDQYDDKTTDDLILELAYLTMLRGWDDADSLYSDENATENKVRGVLRALAVLMSPETTIIQRAMHDFPEVDVFVHHMMDMERPYNDRPPLEFEDQTEHAKWLNDWYNTNMIVNPTQELKIAFFVAYDPFRRSSTFVWEGYSQWANGIKFYPPSGSRPADTIIPPEPTPTVPMTARYARRKQWDARYEDWDKDEIDTLNRQVFEEAASKNLPIFSHQNKSGFEADDTYGELMGAPCHWQNLLDTMDPPPTVIMAHSGGTGDWFGDDWSDNSYSLQAYNLCVSYPTVYCDFGDASRILDENKREAFVVRLTELTGASVNAPPNYHPGDLCTRTTEVEYQQYELEDKIMYGSDWLVSIKDDRADYLCRFGEAFNATGLQAHRAKFFGENARKAFNLP